MVELVRQGRGNLRHGVFSAVLNDADVAVEVGLIYAARPALDPITDRRLVERVALDHVRYFRACQAIEEHGLTALLQASARDFGNRAERGEKLLHERERERLRDRREAERIDLSKYRPAAAT
jgi:hypothetical protein